MAWTAPRTWVVNEVVTASIMNTHVRDNFDALAGYGTSLPTGSNNLRYILVDSVSAPSYQWELRYNGSASGSYKWEFLGGIPYMSSEADISVEYGSYSVTGSPAAITVPRSGEYLVGVQGLGLIQNNAGQTAATYLGVRVNSTDPSDLDCKAVYTWENQGNQWGFGDGGEMKLVKTLAASDTLRLAHRMTAESDCGASWYNARLFLYPLRIS